MKKGQAIFGLSFGVIFSIIIIIFIISTSIYAINYFLGISNCAKTGLFYEGLQDEIDKAWTSGIYQGPFPIEGNPLVLPSGVEKVCLGSLTYAFSNREDESIRNELRYDYLLAADKDIYIYPPNKACDGELAFNTLEHETINNFFCVDVDKGKITTPFRLSKGTTEDSVTITLS